MMSDLQVIELLAGTRQDRESDLAVTSCNDYLRMGSSRSLRSLLASYIQQPSNIRPTDKWTTISTWSNKFNWQERSAAYDAEQDKIKTSITAAARKASLESGLALEFNRVEKLKTLAADLEAQIFYEAPMLDGEELAGEPDRSGLKVKIRPHLWTRDVKQIGSGESAVTEEIFRYNAALVNDYRGVLDDIAKETGGRKQQVNQTTVDLSNATDEQVDRIANGEDPIKVMARRG